MADKRQQSKGRRTSHTFAAMPHNIFRADYKNKIVAPASELSHMAAHLLVNLFAQFDGKNNGDLSAAPKIMELYGWSSRSSVHKALTELLALGFIEQTRQGGRNQCSLYAVTWLAINECGGKLDVKSTSVASNLWKPENREKIDWRFVQAWEHRQSKLIITPPSKLKSVLTIKTSVLTMKTSHEFDSPNCFKTSHYEDKSGVFL
jgi:hypothetical protein